MTKYIKLNILYLLLITLVSRAIAFYFFGDIDLVNEWKILVHNLETKGVLGYNVVLNEFTAYPKLANENEIVLPSVFMPPFYAYYLFVFKFIFSSFTNYVNIIIISQVILSTLTSFIFFKMLKLSETYNFSIFFTLVFSLIPINIYAAVQISSISIQIFLLVYFFYLLRLYSIKKFLTVSKIIVFSILSGLLILLRGEFILFYLLSIVYFFLFYKKNLNFFLITLMVTSLIISPYIIRNYYNFNSFVITKSFGFNLLKGNNPEFKVEGNTKFLETEFDRNNLNIKTDKMYEIRLDNFYKDRAIEYIKSDKTDFFKNYFVKILSFIFLDINSTYEKYYNIFHFIPKLILSAFSLFGAAIVILKNKSFIQYIGIYFLLNIFFFSIFFILPRYSLILLPVQILLSLETIKFLRRKLFN
tara:strand:+ start:923 stop:2167 length:1245 start_codon:yes stop_codon:yes gene_type:complete